MALRGLHIEHFRNLQNVDIRPSPSINLIVGDNAAGKTSLLEAIYCLSTARSFRGTSLDQLVSCGSEALLVRGLVECGGSDPRPVVIRRTEGCTELRVDAQEVRSLAAVSALLPVQVLNTESQRLLTDGPETRRALLNWGVFHVEQGFSGVWRQYRRALRQRNVALRCGHSREAAAWEPQLAELGEKVDHARCAYIERLLPAWTHVAAQWLPTDDLTWRYTRGWTRDDSLAEILAARRNQELDLGYTLSGPHRADLRLLAHGRDAHHGLSRGQQKLAVIALRLAQMRVLSSGVGRTPTLLVDDLPAELDRTHRTAVLEALFESGAQLFLTAIHRSDLDHLPDGTRMFHVEQGRYREVV
ncbi:DNA replication/repair protein RecF [Arhodomonas sp. AD133]|uniref:DNA replication/repair protein RecF n=1 Tax=Arhodomonas sp. AD133 TaxID=3415009 RepID=UPI003EC0029D